MASGIVIGLACTGTSVAQADIQTSTDLVCNPPVVTVVSGLGMQPSPNATERCQVIVSSQDGVTSPSGDVIVGSTGSGSFDTDTVDGPGCTLAPTSPPDSSCTVDYTPGATDTGMVTLSAGYAGSGDQLPSQSISSSFEAKGIAHAIPVVFAMATASRGVAVSAAALSTLTVGALAPPIAKLTLTVSAPLSLAPRDQLFGHLTVLGASHPDARYHAVPHRSLKQGRNTITVSPVTPLADLTLGLSGAAVRLSPSAELALHHGHRVILTLTVTAVNQAGDVGHKRVRVVI